MENLTEKDQAHLKHVLMLIGKRVVPTYFYHNKRIQYLKWQGNACRQTAMFVAAFLQAQYPNAIVKVLEGTFEDAFLGGHEHAYTYMKFNTNDTTGLLVDVGRVSYKCMVEFEYPEVLVGNLTSILTNYNRHSITQTNFKSDLNWESMLTITEYYTGKHYWQMFKEMKSLLDKYLASS